MKSIAEEVDELFQKLPQSRWSFIPPDVTREIIHELTTKVTSTRIEAQEKQIADLHQKVWELAEFLHQKGTLSFRGISGIDRFKPPED